MLDGTVIVKDTYVPEPELGTLPVPDQPIQTYRTPVALGYGEVTDALTRVPESNQPLDGVGELYGEETVR